MKNNTPQPARAVYTKKIDDDTLLIANKAIELLKKAKCYPAFTPKMFNMANKLKKNDNSLNMLSLAGFTRMTRTALGPIFHITTNPDERIVNLTDGLVHVEMLITNLKRENPKGDKEANELLANLKEASVLQETMSDALAYLRSVR